MSAKLDSQDHQHDHDHSHQEAEGCQMERWTNTELIVREDIIAKAKELADLIATSTEVEFYKKAEAQIRSSENIQTLINAIKKKQKEIVAFESFQNKKMVDKIEGEIEELQNQLDNVPIVQEFQQSQSDINYLLQLVMTVVRDSVSKNIEVEEPENPAE